MKELGTKERSQTPFREEFKDRALGAGGFSTVREFENDPRWVVKEIRPGKLEQNIAEAKKGIEAAEKFLPKYPFETPKFDAALKKLEKLVVEHESEKK